MTSKLVVNTIESDTGISSVSFASSISMSSTSKFFFSAAGIDIGADTNINRPASGVLGFNINGNEKVRINSNGFIGINTSSILAPLHTYNDTNNTIARLESGDATCRLQLKDSAGEGYVIASGDNLILANTSSITERLRITSSGYIKHTGLRSGNSQNKLAILTTPSYNTSEEDVALYIAENESGMNQITFGGGTSAYNAATNIRFLTASAVNTTTGSERLRITSGGDLRLGLNSVAEQTDSAHYIMTLTGKSGQTGAGAIAFKDPSANTDGFIFADSGNLFITADYSSATADSSIRFRVDGSSEKLRITSDGKVGINDTAPERTVDVKGSNCMVQLEGTGGSGKQWSLCSADNTTGAAVGSAGMFAIYNDTDGVAALRVSNSNYVLKPKLPYFYATATPTVTSNYIHSFGNVHGNNGNHYNNSNGRFVAPVSGFYWFACGIWCNSSSTSTSYLIQLSRYVNSTGSSTSFAGANHRTQYNSLNCSGGTYMESGDYVWIQQTGISIQASTPRNYFSGYLVG